MVDVPGPRSSHARATPRGGGLGRAEAGVAAGCGAAFALLGLCDDRFSLPAGGRLLVQAAAAVILVAATGGLERLPLPAPLDLPLGPLGGAAAALWVVAVAN